MSGTRSNPTSRREFLAVTGIAAAASLSRVAVAEVASDQPHEPPTPSAVPVPTVLPSVEQRARGITVDTIAAAEMLAGISFTPAKREMMAKTIKGQVARIKRRQAMPLPGNEVAPALTFDPRLHGMTLERKQRAMVRTPIGMGATALPEVPGNDEDIAYAPVKVLSRWIEARKLTSRRLTEISLERLRRLDSKLKFVITLTEERALRQADRADAEIASGKYRWPLHGIPWGAKDLLDTAEIATTWGAEPYVDRVPRQDAAVVRKLDEAGAVLVAKTTLGALAMGDVWHGGRTNNPWKLASGSSGSSAGSAAAVASGCIGFGIGTETLGSIISPSKTCGSTGLRPTFGRVSRAGAMALCWSLDKIGPMTRCAEDCALVLGAINGPDVEDSCSVDMPFNFDASKGVKGLRVGYIAAVMEGRGVDPMHKTVLEKLRGLGCEVVEFELPKWPYDTLLNILHCEAAAAFEELMRSGREDLLKAQGPDAWPNTFRESWFIPGVELVQAQRFRRQCMVMMMEKFAAAGGLDAMLDPTNTGQLCMITNSTGHPSLTIRIGFGDDGLPLATTLVGRLYEEGTLVRLGSALEGELGVWEIRPEI